jgi:hypothetical protein
MIISLLVSMVLGQEMTNPAYEAPHAPTSSTAPSGELGSWNVPPVVVAGHKLSALQEEDPIGVNEQPRWTAHRRFGETRVYVIPEGQFQFEYWGITETPKSGPTDLFMQYEVEIGLPWRFQLDLYAVQHKVLGTDSPIDFDQAKIELRWAFAKWGAIPLNPTLYLEYKGLGNEADHVESKLLLSDEIGVGWHYGANLVWEHTMGDTYENSFELNQGLSYTVADAAASIGVELAMAFVNEGTDFNWDHGFQKQIMIGPSIQIRPLPRMHLDVAPLFGLTSDALAAKVFVVLGWEL